LISGKSEENTKNAKNSVKKFLMFFLLPAHQSSGFELQNAAKKLARIQGAGQALFLAHLKI